MNEITTILSFPAHYRQPYCANTANANLCSHIWAICYMAQSLFSSNEIIAEPCLRKCPSGVNLNQPTRPQLQRRIGKSYYERYGYALNYGIPMGQSTPKTWFALMRVCVCGLSFIFIYFSVPLALIVWKIRESLFVRGMRTTLGIKDAAWNHPSGMYWFEGAVGLKDVKFI